MVLNDIAKLHQHNINTFRRSPLAEISGALGDLGTLLPLTLALALQGSVSLPNTLVFSGLFNVLTGLVFGIPLPVQPMKAIAAAAITSRAPKGETLAAGALVSIVVGVLSMLGLLRRLTNVVPVPVIKGIQLGAGLSLVISGGAGTLLGGLDWTRPSSVDNRLWAIAAFLLLVLTARIPFGRGRVFPYALIVFVVGLFLAILVVIMPGKTHDRHKQLPEFEFWHPVMAIPSFDKPSAWSMAVAQLPLTTLNSVIAVTALAFELFTPGVNFPLGSSTPTVTELGMSVALMNLVGCWFGAMPVCHGAGGLAAQYRFGARSGASIVLLGLFKLLLGLFFGTTLLDLLGTFPRAILGIMVIAAGLELARAGQSLNHGASDLWQDDAGDDAGEGDAIGRENSASAATEAVVAKVHRPVSDEERAERWTVMLITTAGILAFRNDAVGFVAGMMTSWAYKLSYAIENRYIDGQAERRPLLR